MRLVSRDCGIPPAEHVGRRDRFDVAKLVEQIGAQERARCLFEQHPGVPAVRQSAASARTGTYARPFVAVAALALHRRAALPLDRERVAWLAIGVVFAARLSRVAWLRR